MAQCGDCRYTLRWSRPRPPAARPERPGKEARDETERAYAVSSPSPETRRSSVAIVGPRRELDGVPLAEAPGRRPGGPSGSRGLRQPTSTGSVARPSRSWSSWPRRAIGVRSGSPVTTKRLRTRAYVLARPPPGPSRRRGRLGCGGDRHLDRLPPEALATRSTTASQPTAPSDEPVDPRVHLDPPTPGSSTGFETTKWDWREVRPLPDPRGPPDGAGDRILQESADHRVRHAPRRPQLSSRVGGRVQLLLLGRLLGRGRSAPPLVQCRYLHEIGSRSGQARAV